MPPRQIRPRPASGGPGKMEAALNRELKPLPEALRTGVLAESARGLARRIDGGMSSRDDMAARREIRVTMGKLMDQAPLADSGDKGDELQERRQARLREASDG